MEKQYFDKEPELVVSEGPLVRINFDVEHDVEQRQQADGDGAVGVDIIKAYVVRVHQPLTRDRIVDAIITAAYPNDKMQAVVNNFLLSPEDDEARQEMADMQAWRQKAKDVADEVMGNL